MKMTKRKAVYSPPISYPLTVLKKYKNDNYLIKIEIFDNEEKQVVNSINVKWNENIGLLLSIQQLAKKLLYPNKKIQRFMYGRVTDHIVHTMAYRMAGLLNRKIDNIIPYKVMNFNKEVGQ